MAVFAPGVWSGVDQGMAVNRQAQIDQQLAAQRKQEMEARQQAMQYQNFQMETARAQQARDQQARQASAQLWQAPPPPQNQPPAPFPGTPSVPGGQQQPMMPPAMTGGAPAGGPPGVSPYRTVPQQGQQQAQPQQQQPMAPPPVSAPPPQSQGISLDSLIAQMRANPSIPPEMYSQLIAERMPLIQETDRQRAAALAERRLDHAEASKAPTTRNRIQGGQEIQEEWDPVTRTFKPIGSGPRFAKQVGGTGGGSGGGGYATTYDKLTPEQKRTVDYYAELQRKGDTSWRTGLSRNKAGSALIQSVDERIANAAFEDGSSPGDQLASKADYAAKAKALKGLVDYGAKAGQFARTMDGQMKIVTDSLDKGAAGGVPLFNKWINATRSQIAGDPDLTKFDNAVTGLAREHARFVTGLTSNGQLHASATATGDRLLNRDMSPAQIKAVVEEMKAEQQAAIKANKDETAQLKKEISGGSKAEAGSTKISSDADYNKLPSGTEFIAPDGSHRRKP